MIQSKPEGLRIRGLLVCVPLSLKALEPGALPSEGSWMSQLKKKENLPFLCIFGPFESSRGWMMPTHLNEDKSLYSVY